MTEEQPPVQVGQTSQELMRLTREQLLDELSKDKALIAKLEEFVVWSGFFSIGGVGFSTLSFLVSMIQNFNNHSDYFARSLRGEAPIFLSFASIAILSAIAVNEVGKRKSPELPQEE